jgi:hypothetical protein
MAWHQAGLRVIAFHLGVQPNGEEITMSVFEQFLPIADEETLDLARAMKEARGNQTKEAAERCAESDTFPRQFDSDERAVSMIIR